MGNQEYIPPACRNDSFEDFEECQSAMQALPSETLSKVIGYTFVNDWKRCFIYFSGDNKPASCPDESWTKDNWEWTIPFKINGAGGNSDAVCYACDSLPTQVPNTAAPSTGMPSTEMPSTAASIVDLPVRKSNDLKYFLSWCLTLILVQLDTL